MRFLPGSYVALQLSRVNRRWSRLARSLRHASLVVLQSKWVRYPPIEGHASRADVARIVDERKVLLLTRALTLVERVDEEETKIDLAMMSASDRRHESLVVVQALRYLACLFLVVAQHSIAATATASQQQSELEQREANRWLDAVLSQGLLHAVTFFLKPAFWHEQQQRDAAQQREFASDIVARAAWCFCNIACFGAGCAAVSARELAAVVALCQVPRKEREIARCTYWALANLLMRAVRVLRDTGAPLELRH